MTKRKLLKHQGSSLTRFTLPMFLLFGTSVLAMQMQIRRRCRPNASDPSQEADQQSPRHSPTTSAVSLDDTVESRTLGCAVVEVVADKLDSPGFGALLGSSGALATILRHTPAYGAHVEAKQRHIAEQRHWHTDLTRTLDAQSYMERIDAQMAGWTYSRYPGTLVVDINIGEPRREMYPGTWTTVARSLRGPAAHNRLSLRRHVPKGSWSCTCHRRAQGELETYTTKETLTSVIRGETITWPSGDARAIETHTPSDPSVTVSRSTLVEALFITFSQYGTPKLTHTGMENHTNLLSIAVASGVDEVKAQQLMNKLVDRLANKQIIIRTRCLLL